jgi:stress-induced morphogen
MDATKQTAGADRRTRIAAIVTSRFAPVRMAIEDESARHAGHAGVRDAAVGGETHYALLVVSAAFEGQGRVQRSRLVHEALADEFRTGLHALSLTLRTPAEAGPG